MQLQLQTTAAKTHNWHFSNNQTLHESQWFTIATALEPIRSGIFEGLIP